MKNLFLASLVILLAWGNLFAQEVKFSLDNKTNLWGVSKGSNWLIKPKYIHKENFDAQGFARVFERDYDIETDLRLGDLIGLVDKYGNEIVEPKYQEIGSFNQERAVVKKNGFYGYIDKQGKEVIKPKYRIAQPFDSKGHAIVAYLNVYSPREQDFYKIDKYGNVVTENNIKRYSHENGATSAKGKEINGKKIGEWKFYSTSSCLISIENYNDDGVAEGGYKRFFCFKYGYGENMNTNYPCQTGNLKNGKKDGLIVFYNPNNGKPTYTEVWENGVFKKVKDIYDSYGNLVSSTGTGTINTYREDSKYLSAKMEYQNRHRAGVSVWYHPNKTTSQVKQKALYKYDANDVNGLRWEIIEINDYNGKPLPKGTLKNGNGTWISYDDHDKPTLITTYQNGKKVKEETALVKEAVNVHKNILPKENEKKVIVDGTTGERAAGNNSFQMAQGLYYFTAKDYTTALNSFISAANKGEHEAMAYLGLMYYEGLGTIKDYKKAYEWILKAANEGNAKGAYQLGILYYHGKGVVQSYGKAYEWYNVAAVKGIAQADFEIGLLFEAGKGVEKNMQSALNHFKKAADKGNLPGSYATGLYYLYGYAGEKNIPAALKYTLMAEKEFTNNPSYYNNLAYCYFESGELQKALNTLAIAMKVDPLYANGYDSMGEMYLKSGNRAQAIEYYKKAAQMGHANAVKWCKDNNVNY